MKFTRDNRVVGYYRPVQDFNKGKQAEYADRHQMTAMDLAGKLEGENE